MKRILFLLISLMTTITIAAQTNGDKSVPQITATPTLTVAQGVKITGKVVDKKGEPMVQTTIQLLDKSGKFIAGTVTDIDGKFTLSNVKNGTYTAKYSNIGFADITKSVTINGKNLNLGTTSMKEDAIMLQEATVTGKALKVTLKEDTFVYNANAYRTPEGSVLEELVKRLPGAQIDDDGKITINGKEVKKIMLDGKEFMTGDTKTAMKNIPISIIEKVKAYDQRSDLSRVTGIDDGEEETVLDFGVKKGMNKGTFANADLSVGNKNRYAERLMAAYFNNNTRLMFFGNANNVNDMGFPGGGGRGNFGRGNNGLNASKMLGTNFNWEKKDKLTIDASFRWNHKDGDTFTKTASENFVSTVGSFSNSLRQSYTRSDQFDIRGRLEWKPDTLTDIMFRPTISLSKSDSRGWSNSASYNEDPYKYVTDPLDAESIEKMAADSLMVNSRNDNSISYSDSKSYSGMLQFNRKLNNMGRNFTLRIDGNYGNTDSKSLSANSVHLYLLKNYLETGDSTYQTNRFNLAPTKNWSYSAQATYSEPLWKATFLQLRYKYTYSYSKSDRSTYDFSNEGFFSEITPRYRGWNDYLNQLINPYTDYLDTDLSRFSEYKNYTHQIELMFRMIRNKYNLNVGFMVQPQKSHYIQNYKGVSVDTTRNVTNFTPTLDFRYRFSKVSNLRINYRGTTTQPTISQLLDITDDSDPLNISKGNPGLKPAFTQNLRLFYNNYIQGYNRAIMTFVNFSTTQNSISNKVTYDETTGGRTTRPENINGNWNAMGAFMFNTSLDTLGVWNVNTMTNVRYSNAVGYLALDNTSASQKNTTKQWTIGERIEGSYRNSWIEFAIDGSFNYNHAKNELQSYGNLNTWQFAYGATLGLTAPWGTSLSTDLHENSRRGYSDNAMNTNELVWNAQIAQSFLKGKALSVSLQFYDILKKQSNISRSITAMQRSDTEYNAINSYVMLHATYRLNIFGGKGANMGGPDGGFNRGGRPTRGGFGGNRGGRGGFGGPRFD